MRFLLFFSLWISIITLAYVYVGRRFISAANLDRKKRRRGWVVVIIFLLLPMVPFFLWMAGSESDWLDGLFWVGYVTMGFFSLVLTLILFRDLIYGTGRLMKRLAGGREKFIDEPNMERRRFLIHSTNLGILSVAGTLSGYGLFEAHERMQVEEVSVILPNLPAAFEGFQIVQFTDIHAGPTIKRPFVENVVARIQNLNADLIAFTGDLVDGTVSWLKEDVAPLNNLTAPYGKFFITGNHEYYSGAEAWIEHADKLGFTVLLNEHRVIRMGNDELVLAGVTDFGAADFIAAHASDPIKAIAGAPKDRVKILLAHQPRSIFAAESAGYDLQLSGHTHGGQFFPWNYLATVSQPYIKGLFKHGRTMIYVSRGTGYWGPPLRLGNPPEITLIRLTRQIHPPDANLNAALMRS